MLITTLEALGCNGEASAKLLAKEKVLGKDLVSISKITIYKNSLQRFRNKEDSNIDIL